VLFRTAVLPPGTASGLWLDMADQDLVVIGERTAPDHQSVILGHELWHMRAGHCGRPHVRGAEAAPRLPGHALDEDTLRAAVLKVAARTRFDPAEEKEAEAFGLLPAGRCRTRPAGSSLRGPVRRDRPAGRIEASPGYPGPQG
jgi:hypothetical protein